MGVRCPLPLLGILLVLAGTGCSTDPNRPYPVRGVIVFEDGQPARELAGGSVTFSPKESESRGSSVGTIEEDASFTLSCKKEGDGAVPGQHRVTITLPTPEDEEGDRPKAKRTRPAAIIDPESANQEVTVEPKSNSLTLKVRRPPVKKK